MNSMTKPSQAAPKTTITTAMDPYQREDASTSSRRGSNFSSNFSSAVSSEQYHDESQRDGSSKSRKHKEGKISFMSHLKGWMSASEPSMQAFNQHKKTAFEKAGVDPRDPRAVAKMHLPSGRIPDDAIRSSGPGPDPEEVLFRKLEERRARRAAAYGQQKSSSGASTRTYSSYEPSVSSADREEREEREGYFAFAREPSSQ